jgi:hypothetical protein
MREGSALHRGCEYKRGTGCGQTACPGLYGGCRVIGIPTVEVAEKSSMNNSEDTMFKRFGRLQWESALFSLISLLSL